MRRVPLRRRARRKLAWDDSPNWAAIRRQEEASLTVRKATPEDLARLTKGTRPKEAGA